MHSNSPLELHCPLHDCIRHSFPYHRFCCHIVSFLHSCSLFPFSCPC
ncbi:hypothetical protein EVA_18698 [gut metagenome]|uniref:Uncharacterized protein n=1 Tax=gut metagenome TaxID=749906 RepID=J9C059_9ZZZZ